MATITPLRAAREATADDWAWLIELIMDELVSASPPTRQTVSERLLARLDYVAVDTFHARDELEGLRRHLLMRLADRLRG